MNDAQKNSPKNSHPQKHNKKYKITLKLSLHQSLNHSPSLHSNRSPEIEFSATTKLLRRQIKVRICPYIYTKRKLPLSFQESLKHPFLEAHLHRPSTREKKVHAASKFSYSTPFCESLPLFFLLIACELACL